MDVFELHTEFCVYVPAEGGAEEASAEVVHAVVGVAKHNCEIFGDVVQEDVQWMHVFDDGFVLENTILEYMAFRFGIDHGEVLRISSAVELKGILHDFFGSKFTPWQIIQDQLSVFLKETFSLDDTLFVGTLKL